MAVKYKDYIQLFNASLDSITRINLNDEIIEVNHSFIQLFKYNADELIGKKLNDLIVEKKDSHIAKQLNKKVLDGKIFSTFGERIDKLKNIHKVIITGIPIIDNTKITGAFVIYKDITGEVKSNEDLLEQKMIFESLFKNSNDAIVTIDTESRILSINDNFGELFGYTLEEIKGKQVDKLISKPTLVNESISLTNTLLEGEKVVVEGERYAKDGTCRLFSIQGVPIIVNNKVTGGYGIYKDITDSNKAEKKISAQRVIYEALFKNSSDAIVRFDKDHRIIDINENFKELFKYTIEEIVGRIIDDVIINPELKEEAEKFTELLFLGNNFIVEGIRHNKYGEEVDVLIKSVPIIDNEEVIGGYGIYTDISARKEYEKEILYMSYHDRLTGVYNRRFFEEEFNRLDADRYLPMSLIMADVNGLKLTNDAFGHEAGDELLIKMARILNENCRQGEIIARLGGDEFVILLPNTPHNDAEGLVERIKESCHKQSYRNIEFSMSFGCSSKVDSNESTRDLFKRVEDLMYRNKLVESPSIRGKMFDTIINTLHAKNEREERHSYRVSDYCEMIGRKLGFNSMMVKEMKMAGWLHDIGKIAISDTILDKEDKLNNSEWLQIKKHPEIGYRILNSINEFTELAEYILSHHERLDGLGYPKGLKGNEIPIQSSIIAVADAYDAMISERTYRESLTISEAIEELKNNSGTQFDPRIVNVFVKILEEENISYETTLSV